jgi:two-component system, cell cycle sensor histidine kinase and response regulator CckA
MILIIDDENAIRDAVTDILEIVEVQAICASNGKDGIDLFCQHAEQIQAILLDMRMPIMSGSETYRALRELDSEIPIILSSGYDDAENAAAFHGDENVTFLHKPYSMDTLIDLVQETLRGSDTSDAR